MLERLALYTADFIERRNKDGEQTVLIMPVGPKDHYPRLADICNQRRINWKNVHTFNMDEWLTWDCQLLPLAHPYSFEGFMRRNLYDLLDSELRPESANIHFPRPDNLTRIALDLRALGGANITVAGFGYSGHIAANEPPSSRWVDVSVDDYRRGETRILPLNDETLIAFAHRTAGGDTRQIPPMAISLGMRDILASRRILFVSSTGEWKQHTLRVLMFHDPTVRYPCTLAAGHSDVEVWVDRRTAERPQRTFGE
jgi:glucosamine-6-phosphate deaminase